jgi:anti-anti-sigma factor
MPKLKIDERQAGDIAILDLSGKIEETEILRRSVRRLLEEGKPKILLNFENVTSVDHSALMDIKGTLLPLVKSQGGELKALHVQNIKKVAEVTSLVTLLDCHESEVVALMAFP